MSENKKVQMDGIIQCPECDSTRISRDYKRGELVCTHVIRKDLSLLRARERFKPAIRKILIPLLRAYHYCERK